MEISGPFMMDGAAPSPNFPSYVHVVLPVLRQQGIAITGKKLFALYPIPHTKCQAHPLLVAGPKRLNDVAGHIASHLNLFKCNANGWKIRDMELYHICGECGHTTDTEKGITKHLSQQHGLLLFSDRMTDIAEVCAHHADEPDVIEVIDVEDVVMEEAAVPVGDVIITSPAGVSTTTPSSSPQKHKRLGLHPILKQNRMAVRGRELFALFPVGAVFCSAHHTSKFSDANYASCIAHVAGRDHLNYKKSLPNGIIVPDLLLILVCEVCCLCFLNVKNMRKHFDTEHVGCFSSSTLTDLLTVTDTLIAEDDAICNPSLKFPLDSPDVKLIGKIAFNVNDIIGRGSDGTRVFRGLFEYRDDVAVKRVQNDTLVDTTTEISHLRSLNHENIVKYFIKENDMDFTYIAITLAVASLDDFIRQKSKYPDIRIDELKIFKDCCSGLEYLHYFSDRDWILHRDIKPHNILIAKRERGDYKAMLSDFGIAKRLSLDATLSITIGIKGTKGWIAPELLAGGQHSRASDVFSMGCVAFFVFTGGLHPFGEEEERNVKISKADSNLKPLAEVDTGIYAVVNVMISHDPGNRPPISAVLKHQIFWDAIEKLQFLVKYSNSMESMDGNCETRKLLEVDANLVLGVSDWKLKLNSQVIKDLEIGRKGGPFKGELVYDLVRAIRNKSNHFVKGTIETKKMYVKPGGTSDDLFELFDNKFPRLIHHCYVAAQIMRHELAHYYDNDKNEVYSFPALPKSPRNSVRRSPLPVSSMDSGVEKNEEPEIIVID